MEVNECLNFKTLTCLGEQDEKKIQQSDILSSMAFDTTGKYLSVGDYGGRCIIFQKNTDENFQTSFDYLMEF